MGAWYLGRYRGIENNFLIDNQAAYLQNWIAQLKNDKQLLIEAASNVQKAVDYILRTCLFWKGGEKSPFLVAYFHFNLGDIPKNYDIIVWGLKK